MDFLDGWVTNVYDKLDLVQVIDMRTLTTNSFQYNSIRQKVSETDPLGRVTTYAYCDCGDLESITDPLNYLTLFYRDNQGNPTNIVYSDGYAVDQQFDSLRRLTNRTDTAGASTSYTYNNQGLIATISNTAGQVAAYTYDINDRLVSATDVNGVTVTRDYDASGRLRRQAYPDNGQEVFNYTQNVPGMTSYTNPVNNYFVYAYDAAGRKTNEIAGTSGVNLRTNRFAYNAAGDLLTLLDGKGNSTAWYYDSYGRVTNKLDATGASILRYAYDANHRLTNRWSARGITTTYRYDKAGNLTNVVYPTNPSLVFSYDAVNRLTDMVDGVGGAHYAYDAVGQVLSEDGPFDSDTVNYSYANRLRTGLSIGAPNASAWAQSYGYDTAKRLTGVSSPAGSFGYQYDATRKFLIALLTLPNTATIGNAFDSVARLTGTALRTSGGTLLNFHGYTNNLAGQRTRQGRDSGGASNSVDYTYDGLGQLQTAVGKEAGGVTNRWQEQLGYAYDAAGNLAYRTNNNPFVQSYAVNTLNQLTGLSRSGTITVSGTTTRQASNVTVNASAAASYSDGTFALSGVNAGVGTNTFTAVATDSYGRSDTNSVSVFLPSSTSYQYDASGNLISDNRRTFDYDDENQLVAVTFAGAWQTKFAYDGRLRRRVRTECVWNGAAFVTNAVVRYIYDGDVVIQERDANNVPTVTYTRGIDLSGQAVPALHSAGGIGGLLARTGHAQLYGPDPSLAHAYYHADGNGNITCLVNSKQAVVARYLYDPYGNTLAASGLLADANSLRFSSKEWHENSGTYYYGFRFYDPNLQRWLNRDPIGEEGGINLYGFVGNAPIGRGDSCGLAWLLFDGEAWGQFTHDMFIGDIQSKMSPDSYLALRKCYDVEISRFRGAHGKSVSGDEVLREMLAEAGIDLATLLALYPFEVEGALLKGAAGMDLTRGANLGAKAGGAGTGGRLGSDLTRGHVADVAAEMESRGWKITGGGGKLPEEYLRGPNGRLGSSYPDITATKNSRTLRVNTADTYADGVTPTAREAANAARIRAQTPGDHLLLVPKP